MQRRQGQDVAVISPPQAIASARMLDTGNFVLYNSDSRIIWQSFEHPTNTLLQQQRLLPGQELFSSASETDYSKGIFRLKMQTDGNLVQYPVNTPDSAPYAYFATSVGGFGNNVSLNLDNDGHLYLLNGNVTLQNITGGYSTEGSIYLMRLDFRGIFQLYSRSLDAQGSWMVRWSSTDDPCTPKGFCRVNAFCVQMDNVPECRCLPGFDFVQSGNYTAGCSRSFSAQSCQETDDRLMYEIREVDNTVWYDNFYDVLDLVTVEECRQACLDDCNCEVAFFKNGGCSKQSLPLRYGRRSLSDSNMALVRVSRNRRTTMPDTQGTSGNPNNKSHLDFLIIGIVLMSVGALALSVSVIYVRWKRRDYKKIARVGEANLVEDISLQAFTLEDLSRATNDFNEELGQGASGTVYKGVLLKSRKLVAVKRLEREVAEGDREFRTELKTIGKTYHRNLVRLLGYCLDGANKLLVLEYMSNGSLADILFVPDKRPSWEERIKLARDISRGILYLVYNINL